MASGLILWSIFPVYVASVTTSTRKSAKKGSADLKASSPPGGATQGTRGPLPIYRSAECRCGGDRLCFSDDGLCCKPSPLSIPSPDVAGIY
jgi:hypothetical protein